jgi:hypothetical protein
MDFIKRGEFLDARLEVFTTTKIHVAVFCVVTLCSDIDGGSICDNLPHGVTSQKTAN